MAVEFVWEGQYATTILGGAAMLALAALLLHINASHKANRAFALFLVLRGLANLTVPVWIEVPGGWLSLPSVVGQFVAVATAHFLVVYALGQRPGARRGLQVALALGAVGLAVAMLLGPASLTNIQAEGPAARPWFDYDSTVGGVLNLVTNLLFVLAAIALAVSYQRAPPGPDRTSRLLLSVGFAMAPLLRFSSVVLFSMASGRGDAGYLGAAGATRFVEGPELAIALGIAALLAVAVSIVALEAWRQPRPALRAQAQRGLLLMLLPVATAVALLNAVAWGGLDGGALATVGFSLDGLFLLDLPLLGTYALVRHQLFGADLKVKFAVRQSTVAAVFIAVFFGVSEGAQEFFSEAWGPLFGIAAAAALVFAIAPLQRFGERVASAAMPGVRAPSELAPEDRVAVYRDQVRFAWADGVLDRTERMMLDNLRDRLGLSADEAVRLEAEVVRA